MKMNTSISVLFFMVLLLFSEAKAQTLLPELEKIFGKENVKSVDGSAFKEYYVIGVTQPIDHANAAKGRFSQRLLLGYNDASAPVVMETEGYSLNPTQLDPKYKTELTELLDANQIVVEHRYFGESIPDAANRKFLTYKQASDDYHSIRQKLDPIFRGGWATTGLSKTGDAAFAYKFFYPNDVKATLVYGISLTMEQEDKRFENYLRERRKTEAGKKIFADQIYLFENKKRLLPAYSELIDFVIKLENFPRPRLETETLYDYAVLELEVLFWQRFGKNTEEAGAKFDQMYDGFLKMGFKPSVPAATSRDKLILALGLGTSLTKETETLYYQAFTQGGYYGYDEEPFKKYLKNENYSLARFIGEDVKFDPSFRRAQKKYAETTMSRMIFINAETDPWSVFSFNIRAGSDNLKLVQKDANHSLKLKDFDHKTREAVLQKLKGWLSK